MKETTNFKLKKPENTDIVDIIKLNENMDILDTQVEANKIDILTLNTTVGSVAMTTTAQNIKGAINELDADTVALGEQINSLDALIGLGGVKESGSNANGNYIKFEDGTIVVSGYNSLLGVTTDSNGIVPITLPATLSGGITGISCHFAIELADFTEFPVITCVQRLSSNTGFQLFTTKINFVFTNNHYISFTVIGRWK